MYEHIEHTDVALAVKDRCRLAGVPRSSYYRQRDREKIQADGVVEEYAQSVASIHAMAIAV